MGLPSGSLITPVSDFFQIFQFEIETLKNGRTNVQTVEIDGQDAQEFNYVLKMLDQTQVRDTDKS